MTRTRLLALAIAGWLASSAPAHATFIFSDVEVTSNSVTFTIDGDMTGYVGNSSYLDQFSIVYVGDLWTGATSFSSNTWSSSVFDNESILINGNTGGFNSFYDYSWSMYGGNDLSDASAVQRRVTVTLGDDYLDPLATSGEIRFVWGNGNRDQDHAVLASVTQWNRIAVPEPATLALFGLGLAGLAVMRRRRTA